MDSYTTIGEPKDQAKRFCDDSDWGQYHGAKDLTIGLSVETAELLEIFRRKSDAEVAVLFHDEEKSAEIKHGVADASFVPLRLAQKYGKQVPCGKAKGKGQEIR